MGQSFSHIKDEKQRQSLRFKYEASIAVTIMGFMAQSWTVLPLGLSNIATALAAFSFAVGMYYYSRKMDGQIMNRVQLILTVLLCVLSLLRLPIQSKDGIVGMTSVTGLVYLASVSTFIVQCTRYANFIAQEAKKEEFIYFLSEAQNAMGGEQGLLKNMV